MTAVDCVRCAGRRLVEDERTGEQDTCPACRQGGQLRTQVVLTVANLDTGVVASANVVPGMIEPEPAPGAGWQIPLRPVVARLAAEAGVAMATVRGTGLPDRPLDPDQPSLSLPPGWRPDLPDEERVAGEAEAFAAIWHRAWQVFTGRTAAPEPVSHDELLRRLCVAADQLCLDLVVEARWHPCVPILNWDVRFDVPGAAVPHSQRGYARDLVTAVTRTSIVDALDGLAQRSLTAPAYYLLPDRRSAPPPESVDVDQLERRVRRDCGDDPPGAAGEDQPAGAQAIWRDGCWQHTSLRRIPGSRPAIPERSPTLRRVWQPPLPPWLGEPVPSTPCPDCSATGWRHPVLTCLRCGGHGRLHSGAVVTVTDLRGQVVHLNWRPDADADTGEPSVETVGTFPGGRPALRLPERFRLGGWAAIFGVRTVDLLDLTEDRVLGQDLRDGIVTVSGDGTGDGTGDPVRTYLAGAAAGRPGARLLLYATDWPGVPDFDAFATLILGLGLAVRVCAQDLRHNAGSPMLVDVVRWEIGAVPQTSPVDVTRPLDQPAQRSVAHAVSACLRYLELAVSDALPFDARRPVPVPQQPVPPQVPDLITRLGELAARCPGEVVAAHLDHAGCQLWVSASR
ncbi:hypothetical protein ACN27F_21025 [Solwaraspora sp. WMMB335]|uniref:hypothetical protein n=1 Tax=Solwaraspora sp. WMMB335 TaxID=3404118 RepID=UPI003B9278F1